MLPSSILTFIAAMGQFIIAVFSGEWEIIFILNLLITIGLVALVAGLFIELRQGKNGVTRGLFHVVLAFLHQQIWSTAGTLFVITQQGDVIQSLAHWRLATQAHILAASGYSIYEVIRYVIKRAYHGNNS